MQKFVKFALGGVAMSGLWGCATPASEANLGNPAPLAQSVLDGKVRPNEYLSIGQQATTLPLCVLIVYDTPMAVAATDWLLGNGADVNLDCRNDPSSGKPLNMVARAMGYAMAERNSPKVAFLQGRADQLIQRGGKTAEGESSRQSVLAIAEHWGKVSSEQKAYSEQWLREERQKNAQMLKDLGAVAVGVTGAYIAARQAGSLESPSAARSAGALAGPAMTGNPATVAAAKTQPSTGSSDPASRPSADQSTPARKTYPFQDTKAYASEGIGHESRQQALQSLHEQRQQLEGVFMGHAPEWRVVRQEEPVCTQHGSRLGSSSKDHWRCTMKVTYAGQSWLDQNNAGRSNGTGATR